MAIRSENVDSESKNRFVVPGKTQHEVLKLLTDDEENTEIIIGQRHITFKIKITELSPVLSRAHS